MLSTSSIISASALLVSLLSSPVSAQLHTLCNPLEKDCPPDPALATAHTFHFNQTPPAHVFNTTAGEVKYDKDTGAAFTIAKQGYSPTLTSNFYFFFGRTEVIMKAAPGQGIISSIVWKSDDLDEVDWEFLGSKPGEASTNYFGKDRRDNTNAGYHPVEGGVQADYHNYTCVWTKDKLEWHLDGKLIRTLLPEAANKTENYPQTPMMLSIGIWAGGDPGQPKGTIEWAGGPTNFDAGPYTMYVKSARVEDYSKGTEYSYGDRTGHWSSIKIKEPEKNSTALENINKPPPEPEKSVGEKWDALPSSTKSGVYAAAGGVASLAIIALLVYYFRQRSRGQKEAAAYAAKQEAERLELEQFRKEGRNPDALDYEGTEYNPRAMGAGPNFSSYSAVPNNHDRSNSLGSMEVPEKAAAAWDPTSSGGGAAPTGHMPLLQHDQDMPQRSNTYNGGAPQAPSSYEPARSNTLR
ncbi:concanavalin A-like lectin/glucanase domain-containing protein [Apiospora arundinis]|uniref:chitinase n=1 Tax=Apiospora arundinis TaxID=335852 RepID=A0ABR2HTY5_9PEZI